MSKKKSASSLISELKGKPEETIPQKKRLEEMKNALVAVIKNINTAMENNWAQQKI